MIILAPSSREVSYEQLEKLGKMEKIGKIDFLYKKNLYLILILTFFLSIQVSFITEKKCSLSAFLHAGKKGENLTHTRNRQVFFF